MNDGQQLLYVKLSHHLQQLEEWSLSLPVELGRQQSSVELFPALFPGPKSRLVIAGKEEKGVSRVHALLLPLTDGRILVTNTSHSFSFDLNDRPLKAGAASETTLPARLKFANHIYIRLELGETTGGEIHSLIEPTLPPQAPTRAGRFDYSIPADLQTANILRWLTGCIGVFQSAATSSEFFDRAAKALVELIGLDCGRVLRWQDGTWRVLSSHLSSLQKDDEEPRPSSRMLKRLLEEKSTFWDSSFGTKHIEESLARVNSLVASPILDKQGEVIGALLGERFRQSLVGETDITQLDAMLVELLACGVAAGLARMEQEAAALTARGRFEQFFTPELSQYLAEHPEEVEVGRDAEVTVLFCDIRGFSRMTQNVGPEKTSVWLCALMDVLTKAVREEEGVIVDYAGDEIEAMWGAPGHQPDHAARACRAALKMMTEVRLLDTKLRSELGEPLAVGIGVNTGIARVGNIGSQYKFKYGPLGNTVNLASRTQGATKYLRAGCLITESTRVSLETPLPQPEARPAAPSPEVEPNDAGATVKVSEANLKDINRELNKPRPAYDINATMKVSTVIFDDDDDEEPSEAVAESEVEFVLRKLCAVRVVNIRGAVGLHELMHPDVPKREFLASQYEAALGLFEAGQFLMAAEAAGKLLVEFTEDGPTRVLLKRIAGCIADPPAEFDAAWELPGK